MIGFSCSDSTARAHRGMSIVSGIPVNFCSIFTSCIQLTLELRRRRASKVTHKPKPTPLAQIVSKTAAIGSRLERFVSLLLTCYKPCISFSIVAMIFCIESLSQFLSALQIFRACSKLSLAISTSPKVLAICPSQTKWL